MLGVNHKKLRLLFGMLIIIIVIRKPIFREYIVTEHISECSQYLNRVGANVTQILIDNFTYPQIFPTYEHESFDFECINSNKQSKLILFWHQTINGLDFQKKLYDYRCPVYNCEITNDRSKYKQSSMVIFNMPNLYNEWLKLLPNKYPYQKWIFASYEAPTQYEGLSRYNGLFDYAATYRSDSDFSSHFAFKDYKATWDIAQDTFNHTGDYYSLKTELVATIVNNCGKYDKSRRYEYLIELNKTILIHVYGKCGTPCPNTIQDCRMVLSKKYKFYLSFENSLCKDYITDNFFDTLKHDIVPVVRGAPTKSYERYVPRSAFINANDFGTPAALGEYLLNVAREKSFYNPFFFWKRFLHFIKPPMVLLCEMCLRLNIDSNYKNKELDKLEIYWNKLLDCEIY
jgi:hypothetical protein